jgi:hypothetical protein
MSIEWGRFVQYRDGFNNDIYHNDKRRKILDKFLDRYEKYQVVGARQVGEWVDATTSQLNGNEVWDVFPRYGLVCLVQKINHKSYENRLLVIPILEWLDQWDGSPSLAPSADDWIEDLGPNREVLEKHKAEVATRLLNYIIERLDSEETPDPKEAIFYAKVAGDDSLIATEPEARVNIRKLDLDSDEYDAPSAYEALEITGSIGGAGFEIHDRAITERRARSVIYLFALAGCYDQDTAKATQSKNTNNVPESNSTPASVYHQDEIADPDIDGTISQNDSDTYGPYVVNKQDFIKKSDPPEFWLDEESDRLHFSYQLGPTLTINKGK